MDKLTVNALRAGVGQQNPPAGAVGPRRTPGVPGDSIRGALSVGVGAKPVPPAFGSGTTSAGRSARLDHGDFDRMIQEAAHREGVDAAVVRAVVEAESGFNPRAVSPVGAKGLMQLMDGTARALGVRDSFDPAANLAGGTRYLRSMMDRFGSLPLALAAYNAGPGAVEKYGGIPPYQETRTYVDRVIRTVSEEQARFKISAAPGGENGEGSVS